jgi:hypothetical protein
VTEPAKPVVQRNHISRHPLPPSVPRAKKSSRRFLRIANAPRNFPLYSLGAGRAARLEPACRTRARTSPARRATVSLPTFSKV